MKAGNAFDKKLALVEVALKQNQDDHDSLYEQKNYRATKQYSAKQISYEQYQAISKVYYKQRDTLDKLKDSLREEKRKLESNKRELQEIEQRFENMQRTNHSFSEIKTNQDTAGMQWFGLYDEKEIKDLYERVSDQRAYEQTARRNLMIGSYTISKNNEAIINKDSVKKITAIGFLDGGFLLDKQTAKPIRTGSKGSFLIVSKEEIGRDGKIIITKAGPYDKESWSVNSGLSEWADWIYNGSMLYVFGKDNKELSSGEVNLLLCINLENGTVSKYDYFKKSIRK
jgi:uncharacterized coiled-coil protein SlyX